MKYPKIAFLAAFAALALITFAADSKDQMITKIVGTDQPTSAPPYALAAHALVGKDNRIAVNAWSGGLVFDGATFDRWKTTFAITDPTAARTITFPNSSGTVLLTAIDQWVFEGATADAYETTVDAVDPTADGTIWLPNTAAGLGDANLSFFTSTINSGLNAPGLAAAVWGGVSSIVFEGATADAHEAALDSADVTADVIYRLADAAAGTYGFLSSTLATNALDAANSLTGTSNGLVSEGATADASETTLAFADATADTTATIPAKAVSGTVEVLSVQDEPATNTITAGQLYGGVITNTGAVGAAVYAIPAPVVGMHFRVYLTVAQDVDLNPADGTQILALTDATGDAISSAATIGNCIELVALSTTTWGAFAVSGTWTDAN